MNKVKDAVYSLDELEPMDDMILIKLPKKEDKQGRIHINEAIAAEIVNKKPCTVLKVGAQWEALYPKESGFTPISVGDTVKMAGTVLAFSVTDFDYESSVAFVYRADIRCKLNIKTESKIIS